MQYPIASLTYAELVKLAERYPPLTHEEQERLAAIAAGGDEEARLTLFLHNTQRIRFFAEFFAPELADVPHSHKLPWRMRLMARWKQFAPKTITIDDIINVALEGFWQAVCTYDPTRGRFNEHANVLIWQRIQTLREKEERIQNNEVSLPFDESKEYPSPSQTSLEKAVYHAEDEAFNREMARARFDWYASKYLEPKEYEKLQAILSGEEKANRFFLAEVGEKLRARVPEADWLFMSEYLTCT